MQIVIAVILVVIGMASWATMMFLMSSSPLAIVGCGLPPTEPQLATSREAFPQLVKELLASPRYGEQQARLWLDVVRYADSNGFDWDEFRKLRSKDYRALMRTPNLVDARRIYDPKDFGDVRFEGIGLGTKGP